MSGTNEAFSRVKIDAGCALACVGAKKAAINPVEAEAQTKAYATQLNVPYVFLANGLVCAFDGAARAEYIGRAEKHEV